MKLSTISEDMREVGHASLDAAGLIPGIGEIADLTNALWYAEEGRYVPAALSLISVIPAVGDAIGKGVKYSVKTGKLPRSVHKHSDKVSKYWPRIRKYISKSREWKPHLLELENVINDIIE